ncbi:MAG: endonuclease [Methylococcales bacterium]
MRKVIMLVLMSVSLACCSDQAVDEVIAALADQFEQSSNLERSYRKTIPVFWNNVYSTGGTTLYCAQDFDGGYHKEVNIEHVFPMSWVMKGLRCGDRNQCRRNSERFRFIESDMHNMYPALSEVNKVRSAMAFGIIKGEKHLQFDSVSNCDFEVDFRKRRVEPAPASRGEIARAMLYMDDTYSELELFKRQRDMLIEWHKADRPSKLEKKRNDIIEQLQGTRNRWIDR